MVLALNHEDMDSTSGRRMFWHPIDDAFLATAKMDGVGKDGRDPRDRRLVDR
jgi:hypothetical protein